MFIIKNTMGKSFIDLKQTTTPKIYKIKKY